ncbi:MAG TPA: hypothetical protein VNB90_05405 [Cytophagaceae bacterium]|nr:hypothetical protein [Cytophagaceae bacterium]
MSLFSGNVFAQNLVSNPSFEEHSSCPERNGDIKKCISWSTTAPSSTPDYFHKCYKSGTITGVEVGVPYNSEGTRIPAAGEAYVGLALFFKKSYFSREYIQNKLLSPLEKGAKYKISFYISLSDSSEFVSDHIGICFSIMPNGIMASAPEALLTARHMVTIKNNPALRSMSWTKVEAEYTATGGEEYIIIGSFRSNMTYKEYKRKMRKPLQPCRNHECAAYYFIDDVSLLEVPVIKENPRYK